MNRLLRLLCSFLLTSLPAVAQSSADAKVDALNARTTGLESRLGNLERDVKKLDGTGLVLFLFGVVCALWAQNTGRSAWLWFFLGLFFSIITVIVLLVKNSNDRFRESLRIKLE